MAQAPPSGRIEEVEFLRFKLMEVEIENAKLRMQLGLDALWAKYGMRKGLDHLTSDGTIVRGDDV